MNSAGLQTCRVNNSDVQTPRTLWELLGAYDSGDAVIQAGRY
jgi:hypothetical protein